jgi:hypothetical protein
MRRSSGCSEGIHSLRDRPLLGGRVQLVVTLLSKLPHGRDFRPAGQAFPECSSVRLPPGGYTGRIHVNSGPPRYVNFMDAVRDSGPGAGAGRSHPIYRPSSLARIFSTLREVFPMMEAVPDNLLFFADIFREHFRDGAGALFRGPDGPPGMLSGLPAITALDTHRRGWQTRMAEVRFAQPPSQPGRACRFQTVRGRGTGLHFRRTG